MAKILIVEDEKAINDLILVNLSLVGHECRQVYDGENLTEVIKIFKPQLVVLDVMIPFKDGFSLLEDKVFENIPVIMLTARDALTDRVRGLNLGADDYITKPFETVELIARIDAVLRRTLKTMDFEVTIGQVCINTLERKVRLNNKEIELTNREFELLNILIINRNIALSRTKLLDLVWGYDYTGEDRTVDVHITKLRKKLKLENYIKTVYKMGYRLEI